MNDPMINDKIERSSLGTQHAKAVRNSIPSDVAAKLVARVEADRHRRQQSTPKLGEDGHSSTYT